MSWTEFGDDCPGCKPAAINVETGAVEPDDSPIMVIINRVWAETTFEERQAFHRVTCLNSRVPWDVQTMGNIAKRIERECRRENQS